MTTSCVFIGSSGSVSWLWPRCLHSFGYFWFFGGYVAVIFSFLYLPIIDYLSFGPAGQSEFCFYLIHWNFHFFTFLGSLLFVSLVCYPFACWISYLYCWACCLGPESTFILDSSVCVTSLWGYWSVLNWTVVLFYISTISVSFNSFNDILLWIFFLKLFFHF